MKEVFTIGDFLDSTMSKEGMGEQDAIIPYRPCQL